MKMHRLVFVLALVLAIPACSGSKEEKKPKAVNLPSSLDGPVAPPPANAKGKPAATAKAGAYRGLDPAKVEKLSPEAKRMLEDSEALRQKAATNPNMSGEEFMKAARGGEPQKPYKF